MWKAENKEKNLCLVIDHDEYVGYYIYVYDYGSETPHHDYLYDDLEEAYSFIEEEYGLYKKDFKETK